MHESALETRRVMNIAIYKLLKLSMHFAHSSSCSRWRYFVIIALVEKSVPSLKMPRMVRSRVAHFYARTSSTYLD